MKKIKIIIILFTFLLLSGCAQTLKDEENNVIKYDSKTICDKCENNCEETILQYESLVSKEELTVEEEETLNRIKEDALSCEESCNYTCKLAKENATGQTLTSNILCQPTNEDVKEIYELYGIEIKKLPLCSEYKINDGGYEGLWTSIFVKPLAWILLKLGTILNNYGLSLVLIGIIIRLLMMPVTKKTATQSENMKKAQPEINALELKYKDKTDQQSVMNKNQETILIYKKYKINPISSCLFALIQIPILFAFIEAINRVPAIFEGTFLGLKLGATPSVAILRGEWWYILIVVLLGLVTYFSFSQNKVADQGSTQKQMKTMNLVLIVFIIIMSFSLSTAIGIYWITSSSFTILQNLIVKRGAVK